MLIYPIGSTKANQFAASVLHQSGIPIIDHPSPDVTHILADVPGNWNHTDELLAQLPNDVAILGGQIPERYSQYLRFDLLFDECYLWENAAITAECALKLAPDCIRGVRVLVIGFGRIGKHLCRLLQAAGAHVSLQTHSHSAEAASFGLLPPSDSVDLVYNTAPGILLSEGFHSEAVKIDLASKGGLLGDSVIHARGLPGKYAPVGSGKLIAKTVLKQLQEDHS